MFVKPLTAAIAETQHFHQLRTMRPIYTKHKYFVTWEQYPLSCYWAFLTVEIVKLFCEASPKIQPEAQAMHRNIRFTQHIYSHLVLLPWESDQNRSRHLLLWTTLKTYASPLLTECFTYNYHTEYILHSPSPSTQTAFVKPTDKLLLARPQNQLCILILPEAPVTSRCLLSRVFLCLPWSCPALLLWASFSAPLTMFWCAGQQEVFSLRL